MGMPFSFRFPWHFIGSGPAQVFWVMGFYWVAEECRRRKSSAAAFNGKGWRQVMEGGQLPASSSEKREVSCGEHREEGESSRERRTAKRFRRVRHQQLLVGEAGISRQRRSGGRYVSTQRHKLCSCSYETSTDGCIYFNQGWKEFLIGTGLGVGTNVLITMKINVLNELNMMVALDTI
ncbi:hypothetical protein TRIUR3_07703 [Triticum urartu]|uniref:TF-B3 domain-containing protein n=1 Tax=Triticum urartu TaxID=4572 RepID=M7YUT4_TRIUA|nr:hypothetical protein TRIUR3_07703 [Triticum urartu]